MMSSVTPEACYTLTAAIRALSFQHPRELFSPRDSNEIIQIFMAAAAAAAEAEERSCSIIINSIA